jgi:hypothetical protein
MDLRKQDARSKKNYYNASLDLVGRNSCSQQIKKEEQLSFTAKLTSMFTYQNPVTAETYAATVQSNDGNIYEYCPLLNCNEWTRFIKDLFNKFGGENFFELISPDDSTKCLKKKISHPIQYGGHL